MIDGWAWWNLTSQIKEQAAPRELSHLAWSDTIRCLGGKVNDVVVTDYSSEDNWIDVQMRISHGDGGVTVNVRLIDGIIISFIFGTSIIVLESALAKLLESNDLAF